MRLNDIRPRLKNSPSLLYFVDQNGVETARSFADLYDDTQALIDRLQAAGVTAGARIGILAPNGYWWVVWDLACIQLGCISVALEQEPPKCSLAELAQHYSMTVLAVHGDWIGDKADRPEIVVAIDELPPISDRRTAVRGGTDPAGTHSLAFSSGTTGRTKGLIIGQPGTERLLDLYYGAYGVAPGDRFMTFLPFANFQQRATYYFCLYHGIDFVSVAPPHLFAALRKYQPTFTIAPPVFYETLHNLAKAGLGKAPVSAEAIARRLGELTGGKMRYMITGMAPIKKNTLDFFWRGGISLYEAFGVTEAGMVAWNKPGSVKVGTVGRPAEPDSVTLAPDGEVIVTRDALWSLGYFDASEDDTKATFVTPRSVATGDIAAFDAEGFLTIVGRKKDAIITKNGEKFHPEPIEAQIQMEPRVKSVVVLGGDDIAGLTAVVSVDKAADEAVHAELRAHVNNVNLLLPPYQQVKRVVFTATEFTVENGLRTKNLKLNRKEIYAQFLSKIEQRVPA